MNVDLGEVIEVRLPDVVAELPVDEDVTFLVADDYRAGHASEI